MLALSTGLIVGIVAGAVLVLIIVAAALRGGHKPAADEKPHAPTEAPAAVDSAEFVPTPSHPSEPTEPESAESAKSIKEEEKKEEPKPAADKPADPPASAEAKADKPATLEVEALSPSMTDAMPALSAEADEMKMGTDELPKFGTSEMPKVGTAEVPQIAEPSKYRTEEANELAEAIKSGNCPKCKAPTFVGDVASDDGSMYTLNGRCGACGHKAQVIDMKVE